MRSDTPVCPDCMVLYEFNYKRECPICYRTDSIKALIFCSNKERKQIEDNTIFLKFVNNK